MSIVITIALVVYFSINSLWFGLYLVDRFHNKRSLEMAGILLFGCIIILSCILWELLKEIWHHSGLGLILLYAREPLPQDYHNLAHFRYFHKRESSPIRKLIMNVIWSRHKVVGDPPEAYEDSHFYREEIKELIEENQKYKQ